MKVKFYQVQDKEAGNIIETNLTIAQAIVTVARFEKFDKANDCFVEDFYQIKEMED